MSGFLTSPGGRLWWALTRRGLSAGQAGLSSASVGLEAQEEVSFEDPRSAFATRTTWEISRALAVLKLCSFPTFVDNSEKWFQLTQRVPVLRQVAYGIVRASFYPQFVGGQTEQEIRSIVQRMISAGVRPMLVCTMEEDVGHQPGFQEDLYDRNLDRVMGCLELVRKVSAKARPCLQLKMTSLFSPDVLERLSQVYSTFSTESKLTLVEPAADFMRGKSTLHMPGLSLEDQRHLERGIERLRHIGQVVPAVGVRLLVDAEFSYVNPALSLLCLAMQALTNGQEPAVWNTYQCYLKAAESTLREERSLCRSLGACFGAKLVRGAYIAAEKRWARLKGLPDPLCPSYQDTNQNYDRCLELLVKLIKRDGSRCAFVAATHNENSVRLLIKRMKEEGLDPATESVSFAQLFGMCDQVTFPLGSRGYNVYKSIPVGPLEEAIPYLARRVTENQSVLAGARKEQQMLRAALGHRLRVF